ncbi:uncharacterized protein LOC111052447 isoform X1 [Nilaparvata lugens]|uniref:uncharacterized protein LOC111052447 isoform X1 n=1 Tax=Nilaparvata lugens TaxID=108931 RepID=UPI00193D571F|nr:uncharacterized protein LOC111052447 isoform X1 [Nilaparvata lugens]
MKPTVVADEMFPEGAGPYMDLEENLKTYSTMKISNRWPIQQSAYNFGLLLPNPTTIEVKQNH